MYYTGRFLRICTAKYGQGTCWPLVTNYPVIIPARQMSEVSVITPRLKHLVPEATEAGEILNPNDLMYS